MQCCVDDDDDEDGNDDDNDDDDDDGGTTTATETLFYGSRNRNQKWENLDCTTVTDNYDFAQEMQKMKKQAKNVLPTSFINKVFLF